MLNYDQNGRTLARQFRLSDVLNFYIESMYSKIIERCSHPLGYPTQALISIFTLYWGGLLVTGGSISWVSVSVCRYIPVLLALNYVMYIKPDRGQERCYLIQFINVAGLTSSVIDLCHELHLYMHRSTGIYSAIVIEPMAI